MKTLKSLLKVDRSQARSIRQARMQSVHVHEAHAERNVHGKRLRADLDIFKVHGLAWRCSNRFVKSHMFAGVSGAAWNYRESVRHVRCSISCEPSPHLYQLTSHTQKLFARAGVQSNSNLFQEGSQCRAPIVS